MLASLNALVPCGKIENTTQEAHPALARTASFIRAHDLDLTEEDVAKCCGEAATDGGDEQQAGIVRKISIDKELLSLEGNGSGAIMSALVTIGLKEATDESSRWSATGSTDRILKKRAKQLKKDESNNEAEITGPWENSASGTNVLVWHSKCTRPGHGSDYPVVKSRGLIPASAKDVVELMKDSNRVMEYNKSSVGRKDQHVLTKDVNSSVHCLDTKCPQLGVPGEAKIMSSLSKPPLIRTPLEFKTLFYARHLNSDDGVEMDGEAAYVTVGRSVWETPEGTSEGCDGSTTRCELLLSVNLVREITTENGEKWCELTSITHCVSPGIPIFIGKQVALTAAENYMKDIRAIFEK